MVYPCGIYIFIYIYIYILLTNAPKQEKSIDVGIPGLWATVVCYDDISGHLWAWRGDHPQMQVLVIVQMQLSWSQKNLQS